MTDCICDNAGTHCEVSRECDCRVEVCDCCVDIGCECTYCEDCDTLLDYGNTDDEHMSKCTECADEYRDHKAADRAEINAYRYGA